MRHFHRRRKRRNHRGVLVVLLLLLTVFLVSCVAGTDPIWIREVFGLDVVHYDLEPTQKICATDGETAEMLSEMVHRLSGANSLSLKPFDNASEAVSRYRDALLNDLLRDHYLLYTGNRGTLSSNQNVFPNKNITTLIPEADFESAVQRYFGATSVRHTDGEIFEHLSERGGYTAPLQAWVCRADVAVDSLEETEHTYRMVFRLTDGEESSGAYCAVFVKRDDGSCYFYSLTN